MIQLMLFWFLLSPDSSIPYEGDSIDYQTLAVNHYYGHGFMTDGFIEPFENYQFDINLKPYDNKSTELIRELSNKNFLVNPIYPAFLSIIYKIFGINVKLVKNFQLFFICFASSLFIVSGFLIYGEKGKYFGLIASWLSVTALYPYADMIYTESIVSLIAAVLFLSITLYFKKGKIIFLGIVLGISLMTKGVFYFVLVFFLFFECIRFFKTFRFSLIKGIISIPLMAVLITLPYVVWQNQQNEKYNHVEFIRELVTIASKSDDSNDFWLKASSIKNEDWRNKVVKFEEVILNTDFFFVEKMLNKWLYQRDRFIYIVYQGDDIILAGNNELSVDGGWHKEWLTDNTLFYHTLDENLSVFNKVLLFYKEIPQLFPVIMSNKLKVFNTDLIFVLMVSILFVLTLLKKFKWIGLLSIPFLFLFFYKTTFIPYSNLLWASSIVILHISFLILFFILSIKAKTREFSYFLPFIFSCYAIVLIFYGQFRLIAPFYPVCCLFVVANLEKVATFISQLRFRTT